MGKIRIKNSRNSKKVIKYTNLIANEAIDKDRYKYIRQLANKGEIIEVTKIQDRKEVGYASIAENGYIFNLYVDPQYRNRGIGKELMKEVLKVYDRGYLTADSDAVKRICTTLGMMYCEIEGIGYYST